MSCLTEYDEAKTMNQFKEEGRIEGAFEEKKKTILRLLRKGKDFDEIADTCECNIALIKEVEQEMLLNK